MKKWLVNKADEKLVDEIIRKTDLSKLCAEILSSRGLNSLEKIVSYFNEDELSDPFLLKDMQKAVDVINNEIESGGKICIYGDYDCDGVVSTVILHSYLEYCGADVCYYIPERSEGYGLNNVAIKKLHDIGITLIVTVDNGISAVSEAEYIKELGMKLVITDHHQPPEILPNAEAIVDPHQKDCPSPYKNLAGCGVALKLCAALDDGNYEMVMEQYSELVAIGTIADIVELSGENRSIVKYGLKMLAVTENAGLLNLLEKSGLKPEKIDSTSVAFMIAPRINAAGRFGSASIAVNNLLATDDDAETFSDELLLLNTERKKTENAIMLEIDNYINNNPHILNNKVLFFAGKGWHHGVIGIVSSKIMNKYAKPNFVLCIEDNEARGSGRSIDGFNIHECLTYCKDELIRFGGHSAAGGFSVELDKIDSFKEKLYEFAHVKSKEVPILTICADKVLRAGDFTTENVDTLNILEPFGAGNPQPLFAIVGAVVKFIRPLSNGKHIKLDLLYDGINVSALLFNTKSSELPFSVGDKCDLMVKLSLNEYNGNRSVSVIVSDFRKNGFNQQKYFAAKYYYEAYKRGEEISSEMLKKVIPDRDDLIAVYKKIIDSPKPLDLDKLYSSLDNDVFNYFKLRLCIDILKELEHIVFDFVKNNIELPKIKNNKPLDSSSLYNQLRSLLNA